MPRGCRRKACSAQRRGEGDKAGGGFVTGNPVKRKRRKKEGEKKGKKMRRTKRRIRGWEGTEIENQDPGK